MNYDRSVKRSYAAALLVTALLVGTVLRSQDLLAPFERPWEVFLAPHDAPC